MDPNLAVSAVAATAVAREAHELISRLCYPSVGELGLLAKDVVTGWRMNNLIKLLKKAKELQFALGETTFVHPRLVYEVIERGSLVDDPTLQQAWAGLISSSCTEDGKDQSNLIYANVLNQMSGTQARILDFSVKRGKDRYWWGKGLLIEIRSEQFPVEELIEGCGEKDVHQLDTELEHMNMLGLIGGGFFSTTRDVVNYAVDRFGVNLYVRCQGSRDTPYKYFGATE